MVDEARLPVVGGKPAGIPVGRVVDAFATCEVCGCTPDGEAATDWIALGVAVAEGDNG